MLTENKRAGEEYHTIYNPVPNCLQGASLQKLGDFSGLWWAGVGGKAFAFLPFKLHSLLLQWYQRQA